MIDFDHADIERLWNSIIHYVPERQRLDMAIDLLKSLEDIGVEHDVLKGSKRTKLTKTDTATMNDKLVQRSK